MHKNSLCAKKKSLKNVWGIVGNCVSLQQKLISKKKQ